MVWTKSLIADNIHACKMFDIQFYDVDCTHFVEWIYVLNIVHTRFLRQMVWYELYLPWFILMELSKIEPHQIQFVPILVGGGGEWSHVQKTFLYTFIHTLVRCTTPKRSAFGMWNLSSCSSHSVTGRPSIEPALVNYTSGILGRSILRCSITQRVRVRSGRCRWLFFSLHVFKARWRPAYVHVYCLVPCRNQYAPLHINLSPMCDIYTPFVT